MIGTPTRYSLDSRRRKCADCRGPVWITGAGARHALAMAEGRPVRWVCLPCAARAGAPPETVIGEMSAEQIRDIHAAGVDLTAEQIQAKAQELTRQLLGLKP